MIADTLLIPFILLLVCGMKFSNSGNNYFFDDYLSPQNTKVLKGIFAVAVVIYHLGMITNNAGSKILIHCSGDFAVKFFFFCSGYGLLTQYKKYQARGVDYTKGFLGKHLPKLLVPLPVLTVIYTFFFINEGSYYGSSPFTFNLVVNLFLNNGLYVVYNAWFIFELVLLYIVFFFSFHFGKKNGGIQCCVILTLVLMCAFYMLNTYKAWSNFWYYSTFAFAVGVIYAEYKTNIDAFLKKHFKAVTYILFPMLICTMVAFFAVKKEIENNAGITSAENIILTPLFLLSLMALLTKIQPGCKKFWSFIGEISYELYLVHGLMYLLLHSSVINVKSQVVFVFGVMALSIVAAIIIHYIDFVILKIYFFVYNLFHKTDKKRS